MTYQTNNPVGSVDVRDLYDNAEAFDNFSAGLLDAYPDRFGVPRQSLQGIRNAAKYQVLGPYAAGLVFTTNAQVFSYMGEFYAPGPSITLPYTTTGVGAGEIANFRSVGDAILRDDLADPTGSTIVGRGAGTVETALDALESADASLGARIDNLPPVNRAQPLMSRANKVLGLGQGVVVLGDSISAGAYFGNAHTNGWPNLLSKAINHQFGARNIGAMPTDSLYNVVPVYNTDQLHAVTWTGDWGPRTASPAPYDFPVGNVGAAAGDAVNGKTVSSSASGAYVEIVIPAINAVGLIYYVGRPGGGTFNVTVNGVAAPALNTANATLLYNKIHAISLTDDGTGECTVRLTKADTSPTELQSVIQYRKGDGGPEEHHLLMNVCNWSVSGRQLEAMTEQGIINATNCACLIMALGYNDRFAETDDTYYANYLQRVEWVIEYANINQCLVVVPDFCWYWPKSSRVRTQLRRIAEETNGIYIPFPDKFFPDGRIVVDTTPVATELVDPLKLFADNAHPNYKGNELIFAQIAEALGLGITSRQMALLNDLPYPLKLQGTFKNKAGSVSTIKRTSSGYAYSLGVTATGGGTIGTGVFPIVAVPAKFAPVALNLRPSLLLNTTVGADIGSTVSVGDNGSASVVVSTAAEVSCSFVVAEK